jgi:hypothetical protein
MIFDKKDIPLYILIVLLIIFIIISLYFSIMTSLEIKKIKDYYFKTVNNNLVLDLTLFDEFKFNNYDIIMKNCYYCLIFNFIIFGLNISLLILLFIKNYLHNNFWYIPIFFIYLFHFLPLLLIVINHYKTNINIKSKDEDFLYKYYSNLYYNDNTLKINKKDYNFNFNSEINYNNSRLNNFYNFINWLLSSNVILLIIYIILILYLLKISKI